MGNFHCVPSGCAEVVYQEYLPPKVRWRYPGEAWQEIIGANNYSTEIISDLSLNTSYRYYFRSIPTANLSTGTWGAETPSSSGFNANGINNWHLRARWRQTDYYRYPPEAKFFTGESTPYSNLSTSDRQASYYLRYTDNLGQLIERSLGTSTGIWVTKIEAVDPTKRKNNCLFKIFKNGSIVHQETRSVCPEVEKIPCSLSSEVKTIEIKKLPYLERVDVVPYEYATYRQSGFSSAPIPIVQANDIPDECLNIYKNAIYVIPPPEEALKDPNSIPFDSLVQQICSSPGCPPPEYQVLCDSCGCISCPDKTHPVTCDDVVCCYGDDGKPVLEIPISNYCGGDSCCG